MKQQLRQIYQDLANGKLSKSEALEAVKGLINKNNVSGSGTLLANPIWKHADISGTENGTFSYSGHYVLVHGLKKIKIDELKALNPTCNIVIIPGAEEIISERYTNLALSCFEKVQEILKQKLQATTLLQLVTSSEPEGMLSAGLEGMLKTATFENPMFRGQIILTDPQITANELSNLIQQNKLQPQDSVIRYEAAQRLTLSWIEAETAVENPAISFREDGVYLITGGMGGLGILFAKEILKQTSRARIILTGRTGLTEDKKIVLEHQFANNQRVAYKKLDVANQIEVKQFIDGFKKEYKALHGIVYCAGSISDNFILKKSSDEIKQVLAPKVTGIFNIDEATRDLDLDFITFFSSVASVLGNLGQADYAAANGFMDQYTVYRNRLCALKQRQGKTVSINWPLWQDGGMKIEQSTRDLLKNTMGMHPMQTQTGVNAFYHSLMQNNSQLFVMEGDTDIMRKSFFTDEQIYTEALPIEQPLVNEKDTGNLLEKTLDFLRKEFSSTLKLPAQKIDPKAALEKYGIDSIMAINLVNQLEKTFGSLPKTLFFEYQTIRELADYFVKSHSVKLAGVFNTTSTSSKNVALEAGHSTEQPVLSSSPVLVSSSRRRRLQPNSNNEQQNLSEKPGQSETIAIVGLSGRYPESENLEEYWNNLRSGKDCITEVPKERWDLKEYYSEDRAKDGYHFSKWGGFISGVDEFDPRFFNISPREAETIDPQERLFLQHAWMAIEDAGYTRPTLQIPHENDLSGQVGVYVGLMWSEYQLLGAESSLMGKRMGIGGSFAGIANRVSYTLNLHGPSITVDTMCSSSLTAMHMACQDLKQGRTDMAIAGGVNVSIHPNKYLILSAGQFISSDGHCQSFGEGGDGYIPGEGVGAVVLKRLSDAQKDGNHIYGIIKGSALNHGGKTNGYSVPNPQAQASVINRALNDSNTNARHISYIEAHGTGTKLGDPIEIAALSKTFNQYTNDTGFCLIGSAKSNIGHCESAAGIAGVTKVLLQLKYKQIVPSLHSTRLNPNIDFEKTPFIVNQSLSTWERPVIDGKEQPRIAGVSSFGAGGSNAHIIIEEYIEPVRKIQVDTQVIIPLSARTQEQLKQKAVELKNFLTATQTGDNVSREDIPALSAVAYTLQLGREAMAERITLIASSVKELTEKLQAYVDGEQNIEDFYHGRAENNNSGLNNLSEDDDMKETITKWISNRKLSKLADFWVKGLEFDWNKLYRAQKPSFVSLPAYPFARESYWVQMPNNKSVVSRNATTLFHPLVHENTSDLKQQSYSSLFSGEELFFITDHTDHSKKILMPVCYLEMTHVAVVKSLNLEKESESVILNNIVWGEDFVATNKEKITIALFANGEEQVDYEIYSKEEDGDVIHCQGQALIKSMQPATSINITGLKNQVGGHILNTPYQGIESVQRGVHQLLIHLKFNDNQSSAQKEYMLHPKLINSLLETSSLLSETGNTVPELMKSVRIHLSCPEEAYAWVRYSEDIQTDNTAVVELDIDVYDISGKMCIQFIGVQYLQQDSGVTAKPAIRLEAAKNEQLIIADQEPVLTQTETIETISYPRRIELTTQSVKNVSVNLNPGRVFSEIPLKKPTGISLSVPAPITTDNTSLDKKVKVSLEVSSGLTSTNETSIFEPTSVSLCETEAGIFAIRINSTENNILTNELIAELLLAIQTVKQEKHLKVLILEGTNDIFLQGDRIAYNNSLENKLLHEISLFPYPLIAAMEGNAGGVGYLIGALCDFMVCSNRANYSYKNPEWDIFPDANEYKLFEKRFGEVFSINFLYNSTSQTGEQLKENGVGCIVVPANQVAGKVQNIVAQMSGKSRESLRLLKEHLSRDIAGLVNQLTKIEQVELNEKSNKTKGDDGNSIKSSTPNIRLETHQSSTLLINILVNDKKIGTSALVKDLSEIIRQAGSSPVYKTVIIDSDYTGFLLGDLEDLSVKEVLGFQRLMFESRLPVIALLKSDTNGIAWFLSLFCDACIYNTEASFSIINNWKSVELAKKAALIFKLRFGGNFGKELFLTGNKYTGLELQKRVASIQAAPKEKLLSKALQLAEVWSKEPQESICNWKAQLVTDIKKKIRNLPAWKGTNEDTLLSNIQTPSVVALKSEVIKATVHPEGILEIKMEDREAKNMFSDAFVNGIIEVFEHIAITPSYKVVILTGYDNYFASGGTKESLLSIQEGKVKFTDSKIYHLAMDCKVPVISAMQGHGIGAGWSLGMFADFILFSEESRYVSPYMNYGFTPGAGATYIFPEKMGYDLARETMLTANEYSGIELKDRGMLLPVLPREQVTETAFELARQIAKGNYNFITGLKHQFTFDMQEPLEVAYQCELDLHEKTFVGQKDTLQQIENKFYQEKNQNISEIPQVEETKTMEVAVSTESSFNLKGIMANLRKLLAVELRIGEDEISDNLQYIDLGLDSITGVTWVRKINELYHTAIEATEVYTHPTLAKLSRHVKEEAEKLTVQEMPLEQSVSKPVETVAINNGSGDLPVIISSLKKLLAEELRIAEHEINENMQFVDLGLDSITGVTLVRKINEIYHTSLEATEVYSYPTLAKLGRHVRNEVEILDTLPKSEVEQISIKPVEHPKLILPAPVTTTRSASKKLLSLRSNRTSRLLTHTITSNIPEPVAVIGMAGQFPQAKNIDEFWKNIAEAKNCIEEIPGERWSIDDYYREGTSIPGKMNSKWMGALEEYNMFDPSFFNISPKEATNMDPQQRLFLQTCWHTIENAGYNPFELSGSKCGVFVGCGNSDYHQMSREHQLSAQGFTGSSTSILSGRISYLFNLHGPSISFETACSSSLVAIANACDSLNSGGSDLAIAGGVYIMAGPDMHIKCSQTGMLSADGRCFTFDQRANGFVPGEGVGAVLLKRLSDAERDQNIIYGVIQGWGINQDGQTNGITAPNPEAQTRLEQEVYDKFRLDPESIQLIEAHGTGTKLGDPIEVRALKDAFKKYTQKKGYCALTSVKSNIGHCLTAAGVASFIKTIQAIKNKQLPPTINYNQLNEHIDLNGSPFYINDSLSDWEIGVIEKRMAAISSFGFSGTNAHIVVSEYACISKNKPPISVITQNNKYIFPFSAKTEEQLIQKAEDLLIYIRNEGASADIIETAYTLQIGREAMDVRLGVTAGSFSQLEEKLQAYLEGKDEDDIYKGNIKQNREGINIITQDDMMKEIILQQFINQKNLSGIVNLWVKGLSFDWNRLYGAEKPQRINLPIYPFAKEKYWIEPTNTVMYASSQSELNTLHPLLHSNTFDLREYTNGMILNNHDSDSEKNKLQKIKRISLPKYAFARDRCWVDSDLVIPKPDQLETLTLDMESIEAIINKIENEALDTDQAVQLIKGVAKN